MAAMRAFALLLCALPCFAQEPPPTAFACTLERAILGKKCTYEGDPGPAEGAANAKAANDAAVRACAAAAKSSEMRKACLEEAAQIARSAACTTKSRLVDDEGHATRDAVECVESLRDVIARTERRTVFSEGCCLCLAKAGCGVARNQCRDEMAELSPGAALKKCLARACNETCVMNEDVRDEEPPRSAPRKPEKI
jgi:hypothetical protein